MGYVNYFPLTQKRSYFNLFNARHVFSGRHFGGSCQQTRFIVPVESAGANRVPIVPEDSGSHRHRVQGEMRKINVLGLGASYIRELSVGWLGYAANALENMLLNPFKANELTEHSCFYDYIL